MLYQINNGAVRFGAETVLKNINFEIRNTEKIAVVGRNGCGKTTLLKLIAGEVELSKRDSDEDIFIACAGKPVIGYLKQTAFEDESETLENEVRKAFCEILGMKSEMEELLKSLEKDPDEERIARYSALEERFAFLGGYTFEKEYETVLRKFGFREEDKGRKLSQFSGGQQTKIAFAKMLLCKPDILLLDEPTNHLDMDTIRWLEGYLKDYSRAVVIVSHDRMFLDRIVDVVYEIEYGTARRYPGNYTAFVERKRLNWEKQKKDYELQQKEIARLQALVERFKNKPTKVAMTRSKLKQIEHMEKIEAPDRYDRRTFHAGFTPRQESVTDVLKVEQLLIGYDSVLTEVSFKQRKGQKIGIIGDNGIGKSTLLKTLMGQIPPLGGSFSFGARVDIGYFEQQMAQYSSDRTVLDDFWEEFPTLRQFDVRSALGAFLFCGDDVFKKISMLSGGEKVRLALARIFQRRPNFLILDEPTNHMDIVGKETLESMLRAYPGSVLFVSHDRYFVKEAADSLLVFDKGKTLFYPYGYEQYLESLQDGEQRMKAAKEEKASGPYVSGRNTQQKGGGLGLSAGSRSETGAGLSKPSRGSCKNAGKEEAKLRRRVEKLEALIEDKEFCIARIREQFLAPQVQSDYEKLTELTQEQLKEEDALQALLAEWEELSSRKEGFNV